MSPKRHPPGASRFARLCRALDDDPLFIGAVLFFGIIAGAMAANAALLRVALAQAAAGGL